MCKARHGSVSNALQAPTVASTVASTSDVKQTPAWGVAGFPARLPAAIYSEALAIYPDPFGDGPFQHFHLPNSGAFQPPAAPGPGPGAGLRHPLAPGRSGAAGRRPSNRGGVPTPPAGSRAAPEPHTTVFVGLSVSHTTPRAKSGAFRLSAHKGPPAAPLQKTRPRPAARTGADRAARPTSQAGSPALSARRYSPPLAATAPARPFPPWSLRSLPSDHPGPAPGPLLASWAAQTRTDRTPPGAHRHAVGQVGAAAPLFNG